MRFNCFCAASGDSEGAQLEKKMQHPPPDQPEQPRAAAKAMFLRIVRGLTRSEEEEEEQYQTASEGEGSPPRADTGHLTARSSSKSGSRPQSRHHSQPQSRSHSRRASATGGEATDARASSFSAGASPTVGPADGGRRWGGVLGGVPFLPGIPTLLHALSSRQTDEDEDPAERAAAAGAAARAPPAEPGAEHSVQQPEQQPAEGPLQRHSATLPGTQEGEAREAAQPDDLALQQPTTLPALLHPGNQPLPELSEPSSLMSEEHIRALAAAVPTRHRQARWRLLYSTLRDGISLQTLLRSCKGRAPTVLVVRDMGRHVFGSFCSEPWRLSNRYYGTGETFVFQLEPRQVAWYWWWRKMSVQRNDFFLWGAQEAIAVGGAGGYALWLDEDLSRGLSRNSATFGNDSLSSQEEFQVGAVELWWLS